MWTNKAFEFASKFELLVSSHSGYKARAIRHSLNRRLFDADIQPAPFAEAAE